MTYSECHISYNITIPSVITAFILLKKMAGTTQITSKNLLFIGYFTVIYRLLLYQLLTPVFHKMLSTCIAKITISFILLTLAMCYFNKLPMYVQI